MKQDFSEYIVSKLQPFSWLAKLLSKITSDKTRRLNLEKYLYSQ